jgi:hypothetical protein
MFALLKFLTWLLLMDMLAQILNLSCCAVGARGCGDRRLRGILKTSPVALQFFRVFHDLNSLVLAPKTIMKPSVVALIKSVVVTGGSFSLVC